MPCTDGGVPYPPSEEELLNRKVPAMLCAIWSNLSSAERNVIMSTMNWQEAGVTKDEFARWWELHSLADLARRTRVHQRQRQMQVKAEALAKLTPEEREALGVIP